MKPILNCDMGEGTGTDAALMPFVHAANIACGYHAGDAGTMYETIALCCRHGVSIGAHPSFYDRAGFGRKEFSLPPAEVYELITQQLFLLQEIASAQEQRIRHVKPHGALYNLSARDPETARTIARAVKEFDPSLILYGLSGSVSLQEAAKAGLKTASEVFADRRYADDGSLLSRSLPGALIEEEQIMLDQVSRMVNEHRVFSVSGKTVPVLAETVCIHGDGPQAVPSPKPSSNSTAGEKKFCYTRCRLPDGDFGHRAGIPE